jgi:hypothetical protein
MSSYCNTTAAEEDIMGVCSYWFEGVLLVSALLTFSLSIIVKHHSYRGLSEEEGRDASKSPH